MSLSRGVPYSSSVTHKFATTIALPLVLGVSLELSSSHAFAAGLSGYAHERIFQVDNSAGGSSALTNYPVKITVDTAALIGAGQMQANCNDVRIYSGAGCGQTALDFWVADGTCNSTTTEVWVKVPALAAGAKKFVTMYYGNALALSGGNGNNVFKFFDDFNGLAIDPHWSVSGAGSLVEAGGFLTSTGTKGMWSTTNVMTTSTVLETRTDASSQGGTDFEIGAGSITSTSLWHGNRTGQWISWMSWDSSLLGAAGPADSAQCTGTTVAGRWANTPGLLKDFYTVGFSYATSGTTNTAHLTTSKGDNLSSTSTAGCFVNAAQPAMVIFDHDSDLGTLDVQRLDYVLVRDTVAVPPTVAVAANACEACAEGGTICGGTSPVCASSGQCVSCNADNGVGGVTNACPTNLPYCIPSGLLSGQCGVCVTNLDCTTNGNGTTHSGTVCSLGRCVVPQSGDAGADAGADASTSDAGDSGARDASVTDAAGDDSGSEDSGPLDASDRDGATSFDASTNGGTEDGSIEGGGIACSTSNGSSGAFVPVLLGGFGLAAFIRRRKRSGK